MATPTSHRTPLASAKALKSSGSQSNVLEWTVTALILTALFGIASVWAGIDERVKNALLAGLWAAAATSIGTLPVALRKNITPKLGDLFMGFGAGIMLSASVFSLILPAMETASAIGFSKSGATCRVATSLACGALFVLALHHFGQKFFPPSLEAEPDQHVSRRSAWLFVLAVTLHNLPEGAAIGVAYGGLSEAHAAPLAWGISIQDIPEGLVVAAALRSVGYSRGRSVWLGILSGLVEPLAAAIGAGVVAYLHAILPWGLSAAAGAMLFVIAHDVIPECRRDRESCSTTCALILGFLLMMVLDTTLG